MARRLQIFIQYDDQTPHEDAPFTRDPSTWDIREDYYISGGLDSWFRDTVLGLTGEQPRPGSPATRGVPAMFGYSRVREIADEDISGWITGTELKLSLEHADEQIAYASGATALLCDVVFLLCERHGFDRVRVVFGVS